MLHARYALYFVLSFIATGLQSIIPQAYFASNQAGGVWLGVCLMGGALAAIMSVRGTRRFQGRIFHAHPRRLVVGGFGLIWVTLLAGFWVQTVWLFFASYCLARAGTYVVLDQVDRSMVRGAPGGDLDRHSQYVAVMQIAGIVIAPTWFALTGRGWLDAAVLTVLIAAAGFLGTTLGPLSCPKAPSPGAGRSVHGEEGTDAWFVIYVLAVATLSTLFAASAVLIVSTLYEPRHAVAYAGLLLTLMNLAAVGSAVWAARRAPALHRYDLRHILVAVGLVTLTVALWLWDERLYGILVMLGMGAGLFYGAFEVWARKDATKPWRDYRQAGLVQLFNNAFNYATLLASVLLLGSSLASHGLTQTAASLILVILVGLGAVATTAAMAFTVWGQSSRRRLLRKEGMV